MKKFQSNIACVILMSISTACFSGPLDELFSSIFSSPLEGEYKNQKDSGFISSIEFRGKSTVVIKGNFIGKVNIPGSYVQDGSVIRVSNGKDIIIFTVKDNKTLIGEGIFFEGVYRK
jgi:hypothetical protein